MYPNPAETGLGVFVRTRIHHMAKLAEVRVFAPVALVDRHRRGGRIPGRRADGGIAVEHPRWLYPPGLAGMNPLWLAMAVAPGVKRLAREWPFEIVDAEYGFPDGVAAAILGRWLGKPYSVTLRGSEVLHAGSAIRRRWLQWALRGAACVIAVSERLRQFALGLGAPAAMTRTIPNGVDSTVFHARDKATCRRALGVPESVPVVLSAGHLIELKGHHRVVAALRRLREGGLDARLVIAGGAGKRLSYEAEIRSAVAAGGLEEHVKFTGHLEPARLAEWMAASDVFCLASEREGWPNVVNEALACGTPVVAANVGAVPELLPSETYGRIVPPGDADALADGLHWALTRSWDRRAILDHGQSRDWNRTADEVVALFREALEGRA
jgi:glycosyltransferase involved in cell wall biosynthesis